ncbi:amino acid permease [Ktedonosporobacter rubrisoli]|uniref:Amino acid permease n=1 Tax=Ktedonosporobacter rubrisoli TaxID=2509675 RepID=A0A4P6JQB0_KTERU|nr:amino acid permease [Ktedonosporobacter rubrisoli]QBD77505.1 amino acid permease [Ktedonosporobacter rubrisoli]
METQSEKAEKSVSTSGQEGGLARKLRTGQITMIAIGGAIGTGLFLGSGLAVGYAGPGVIISYIISAIIAYLLMFCLSEMAVAHPTAGSFGVYAERYIGPWAGFLVRYMYWVAQVLAIGGEATAAALYMSFWFSAIPAWIWVVIFSAALIFVNARSVHVFGTIEYWFAMIKVIAIVAFIIVGCILIFGINGVGSAMHNYVSVGGFLPHGWAGVWLGVLVGVFSFYGVEIVAITAGEAENPEHAVPLAMRTMLLRLLLFYIFSLALIVAIVPWTKTGAQIVTGSPFVLALARVGVPAAADIMNFVVITAALSSMNTNLYSCTRMIFSLSRGGYAPRKLGEVTQAQVPLNALLLSSFGLLIAVALNLLTPNAWGIIFGVSIFGGMFVWLMIFITFFFFRRKWQGRALPVKAPFFPVVPIVGTLLLSAVLLTMLISADWSFAWYAGVPCIAILLGLYAISRRRSRYVKS